MNWTQADIDKLIATGKARGYKNLWKSCKKNSEKVVKNIPAIKKPSPAKEWLSWNLAYWANDNSLTLESEYKFHHERKWRFDWALPAIKCAIEYEGIYSAKSRHTTRSGFVGDVEKYNAATVAGWKVIRLTADNYKDIIELLKKLW